jgi:hypothetical protein
VSKSATRTLRPPVADARLHHYLYEAMSFSCKNPVTTKAAAVVA